MGGKRRSPEGRVRRRHLEHADGGGLVGAGDADEGFDRLLRRPRHGGTRAGAGPGLRVGDGEVAAERRGEASRSSGGVRVNSSAAVDVVLSYCSSLAGRGPWAVVGRA